MTMMGTTNDKKRNLPDGWCWVRLGEVIAEVQAGFACGLRDPQGIAQLRMNNLDTRGNFVWDDVLRVPHEANDIDQFQILPGDVLFNNTNSTELVGKSALFEAYIEPIVYSNHFTRLRTVAESLLPEFLASWLNHQWQQGVFAAICNRWIGQSAVKSDKLLNLAFPLPTLPDQRRIAGLLREQMAAVEKARASVQARLEAVKAMPAAFLRQVFPQSGQPLPDGWRWVKLPDVVTRFNPHLRKLKTSEYQRSGSFPIIDQGQQEIVGYTNDQSCIIEAPLPLVVFGDHTKIAKHIDRPFALGADGVVLLSTKKDIDSMFFYYWLSQVDLRELGYARHFSVLKNKGIPLPPLDEQERIVGVLWEQMAAVEKIRSAAEEELQTINTLPAALLRRAFAEEL